MPARSTLPSRFESELLVQLGQRLRAARVSRGLTAAELADQVGISRTTLWCVEKGDPSPTFGTYVRVMAALELVEDLARLAAGYGAPPIGSRIEVDRHAAQDLQSLLMHQAAVDLLLERPALVSRLKRTLERWSMRDDPNSQPLFRRWAEIIETQDWDAALARNEEGQQLRQASPLPTVLPEQTRLSVIRAVRALRGQALAAA
ncbi:MAG: helix-turn-helix transcriptional regulator [Burkholderiales bacterium]|jgi:transcriptional regulator with XRE-family HTH domain